MTHLTSDEARIQALESALHEAKNYVKRNHKSKGAWWDDPRAYEMITKIIEPALQTKQGAK